MDKRLFKNFDYTTLIIVLILFGIGIVAITSATNSMVSEMDKYSFVKKQLISFGFGLILMMLAITVDYNLLGSLYWYFYGANVFILLLVKIFGTEIYGAKSWIKFGTYSFQPSEFSKIFMIIFLGKVLDIVTEKDTNAINKIKNISYVLGLSLLPLALILSQPDLGTAMVVVAIIAALLFCAKLSWRYFAGALAAVAVAVPTLWFFGLQEYQKNRIRVFMNPELDPLNSGFQVIQSKIAIGSGGILGKGPFQGTQTQLGFLPFKENDFIFSVIGEEMGFIFSIFVLLLFCLLLLRLVDIARNSKDFYGSMIAVGIATMIGVHVFQNIAMTIGLMPVTGIPLPFISYGGTFLMANMLGIGLVLNVAMRKQKITF